MSEGVFVVIDGGEGTGTTTMSHYVAEHLRLGGRKAYRTREPGGSVFGEVIRELILGEGGKNADAETLFALFWAARRDHMVKKVMPALSDGVDVISDRFDSSTWAYQVCGQEQPQLRKLFFEMREHYLRNMVPDCYIILDASPEIGLARVRAREGVLSHFDERDIDFHQRVRMGFLEYADCLSDAVVINAELPEEEVKAKVLRMVQSLF